MASKLDHSIHLQIKAWTLEEVEETKVAVAVEQIANLKELRANSSHLWQIWVELGPTWMKITWQSVVDFLL